MKRAVRYLTQADTEALLGWPEVIACVATAYERADDPRAAPPKVVARSGGAWLRALTAISATGRSMGAKIIAKGKPKGTEHLIALWDQPSGALACLMSGKGVTAVRTAGTTAVAIDRIAPKRSLRVAVLGSGHEASTHIAALATISELTSLAVFSPTRENRERFAKRFGDKLDMPCRAADTAEAAVEGAELVIAAARSHDETPILQGRWLERGAMVVSIGSTVPEQREVDAQVVHRADVIVADVPDEIAHETGDMIAAREAGVDFDGKIVSLADVVRGVSRYGKRRTISCFSNPSVPACRTSRYRRCATQGPRRPASAPCWQWTSEGTHMVRYRKNEAREWARENMRGMCNVVIPSYSLDLKRLNEKGIRHDIRKEIEYGFWGTLLVSEVAITVEEYRQFVRWSHEEAQGRLVLVHHAMFNTLEENIEAVKIAEKEGCELVLLGYPHNFYATTEAHIYDYTKKFCDATQLGVILFPVPHWGFERVHPAGMSPDLIKRMVREIPNIVCIKAESGMPTPAGFVQTWRNHAQEVVVTCPVEGEAFPLAGLVPLQFMGTSNYEFYGGLLPRMFNMVREGRFDEMMELYWKINPSRTVQRSITASYSAGAGILHRMVWKYQAWLNGFNGGPLRQPTMKIRDVHMRQLRDSLKRSGLDPTSDPDSEFFVGRNPV